MTSRRRILIAQFNTYRRLCGLAEVRRCRKATSVLSRLVARLHRSEASMAALRRMASV